MANTLASLMVRVDGDASGLQRTMSGVEKSAGRTGGVLKTALGTGLGFVAANAVMMGFGAATDFAGEALIGYNARMEQAQIGFTTLLGSGEKATAFIKELQSFAAKTPFDFPGLQSSANLMLAMGFNAKEVIPTLTAVGDAVAALGLGSEAVNRATYALGQMRSAGRVNAQDMMQLTQLGIPAWQMLADAMGLSVAETRKLSEKGLIPAEKGIKAIVDGIKNGNMGGMMAEQAKTMNGSLATIQDTVMQLVAKGLEPLFLRIRDLVVGFSEWVQGPDAAAWGQRLAAAVDVLNRGINVLVGWLTTGFKIAQQFFGALRSGGDTVAGLATGASKLTDILLGLHEKALSALAGAFEQLLPVVAKAMDKLGAELPKLLSALLPVILKFVEQSAEQFMAFGTRAVDALLANLPAILKAANKLFQGLFDWIINVGVPQAAAAIGPLSLKFIDWVFVMLPKLLDALDDVFMAIVDFIVRNAPVLAGKLVEWGLAFAGFVLTEVVPRLIANLPTILRTLLLFIAGAAPQLIGRMGSLAVGMVGKFIGFLMSLPPKLGGLLAQALARVVAWAGTMLARAGAAGTGFVSRFISFVISLPGRAASVLANVVAQVGAWASTMFSRAVSTAQGFVSRIVQFVTQLPGKLGQIFSTVLNGVSSFASKIFNGAVKAGSNFVSGLMNHIRSLPGKLFDAVVGAFKRLFPIKLGPVTIALSGVSIDMPEIKLFQHGTWDTGSGVTPAILHPHEMVMPQPVANWFREGGFANMRVKPVDGNVGPVRSAGGGVQINLTIHEFYGTEHNIDALGAGLARRVREQSLEK